MAEINKLSVGKVLDKLRSNDAPKTTKAMQLDEKINLYQEIRVMLQKELNKYANPPKS